MLNSCTPISAASANDADDDDADDDDADDDDANPFKSEYSWLRLHKYENSF